MGKEIESVIINNTQNVDVILGLQFGSEGKGAIIGAVAGKYCNAVNIHSAQAGHTVFQGSIKFVNRQLPSSWVNKNARLLIGAGAMINVEVLFAEIDAIEKAGYDIRNRLVIDRKAGIVEQKHIDEEHNSDIDKHGSTKEGVGAAWKERIMRKAKLAENVTELQMYLGDVWSELDKSYTDIVVEGCQGFGLSLFHGYYPSCTSRDISTSSLLAGIGINPRRLRHVYGIIRSYPIRIAGNSGPFKQELSWEEITTRSGSPMPLIEITTVTKRVRRIGEFDIDQVAKAATVCGVDRLVLTFADYLDFKVHGCTDMAHLTKPVLDFIDKLEKYLRIPVCLIGTGPHSVVIRDGWEKDFATIQN